MIIAGILEKLDANVKLLTDSEAKVARWVLAHPHDVLTLTVRELAERAEASEGAVMRMCHSLQIDGYNTLKVLLTADIVRGETSSREYPELNPDVSFRDTMDAYMQSAQKTVRETLGSIEENTLQRVEDKLAHARRVLAYGVAASQVVAEDLSQKLMRLGYPVQWWPDIHTATMSTALLDSQDVLFLVSFSGYTKEVLDLAALASRQRATIVAITQLRPRNPLAELADIVFYVTAMEPAPRISATTSVLASILINGALTIWLANHQAALTYPRLKATEEAIRDHRHPKSDKENS